jgi:diaminohydroxyphosphoribosylaminopyrimidine deaminase / 5-amino-6-(5-phosphoribosylamino)uracil reductase
MYSKFQRRCFDLARLGVGSTLLNPPVGSIIINFENKVVGEGWHRKFGTSHAEVNAVNDALESNQNFSKDKIFVSLEPCFHYGKTPPCVDLILKYQFKLVNVTAIDPNPKVSGKSIEKLISNQIKVEYDKDLTKSTTFLNNPYNEKTLVPFFIQNLLKRPLIILKWAESQDEFIGKENEQIQISNHFSKRLVHKMRAECDAILVGTKTILIDNPELNNRFYYGKSPKRVVLDKDLKLDTHFKVFYKSIDTIVFTDKSVNQCENQSNLEYQKIDFDENMLSNMLKVLYQKNVGVLLVEGGQKLLNSFINRNLWDRAYIIKSEEILRGGILAPKISESFFSKEEKLGNNTIRYYKNQLISNV